MGRCAEQQTIFINTMPRVSALGCYLGDNVLSDCSVQSYAHLPLGPVL